MDFQGVQSHISRRAGSQCNFSSRVKDFSISTGDQHYSIWGKTTFLRGVKTDIFTFPEGSKQ